MNQIIPRSTTDVIIPPTAQLAPDSIEQKFGLVAAPSRKESIPSVAERHSEVIKGAKAHGFPTRFSGYRVPLTEIKWALDSEHKTDWVYMPLGLDESRKRGHMMPSKIRRNVRKAEDSGLFDDFYICHALPSVPGRTIDSIVPWEEFESPTMRRLMKLLNGSTRIDRTFWQGVSDGIRRASIGIEWLVAGAALLVAAAVVVAVVVGVVLAIAVVAVGTLAVAVMIGGIALIGVDPIIYGVVYEVNAMGERVAMCYELAQYDII